MPETLPSAYVMLKSASGAVRTQQKVMPQNVRQFYASDEAVAKAVAALAGRGFTIQGKGPLGISISGAPDLFQKAFAVQLTQKTYYPFAQTPPANATASASYYVADRPLTMPADVAAYADSARLAPPVTWFQSPDPPNLPYFHLGVPDDVARLMDAHAAHDHGVTGTGVRLCVIDSGFWPHPWYTKYGFNITRVGPGADTDPIGHGTGITTNAMAVARGAQFFGVKLWDAAGSFQEARTVNPNVISCSWGLWGYDQALHDEIVDAVANNITVCFACGNGGPVGWPGSMQWVVSVGGGYFDAHGAMQASDYASSGQSPIEPGRQCPDVCGLTGMAPKGIYIAMPTQPGSDMDSSFWSGGAAFPNGDQTTANDGWLVASGTSSACPATAGVAALILQQNPGFTPAQVKDVLQQSCRDIVTGHSASGQAAGPGYDLATGWGLVDGFVAVHPVDIWCKDSADDNGCVPDAYDAWWTSPDVWVRASDDHGPDIGYQPRYGHANWIYVRVRNRGRAAAANVQVKLYWAYANTGLQWPNDWKTDGIKVDGVPGNTRSIASIAASGDVTSNAFEWWPPGTGHFCLFVRVECPDDLITHEGDVRADNNIAMRNTTVGYMLAGGELTFQINASAVSYLSGQPGVALQPVAVPKNVQVSMASPATMMAAPARLGAIQPLSLAAGQTQTVAVKFKAPPDAKVGDVYVVDAVGYMGSTVTGGVRLEARVVDKIEGN